MSDELAGDEEITLSAEMMDREERKALKKKLKEQEAEQAKKLQPAQDEIEAALANSKLAEAQKAKRKQMFKFGMALAGLTLVIYAYNYLFSAFQGGMTYGICSVYLELNVPFPQDLRISTVEDFGDYVRIWYTQLDAFGEYRMEQIQCHFRADEVTGAALDKVTVNRREVDPERVARFNTSIPIILASPPDLTLPYPLPDSLQGLQIDADAFRLQLNIQGVN